MATSSRSSGSDRSRHADDRAMPPIRWPHFDGPTVGLVLVWVAAMILAILVPALIVPPGTQNAPTRDVLLAFGCTLAGVLIVFGVGFLFARRRETLLAAFCFLSGTTTVIGGMIVAATVLTSLPTP